MRELNSYLQGFNCLFVSFNVIIFMTLIYLQLRLLPKLPSSSVLNHSLSLAVVSISLSLTFSSVYLSLSLTLVSLFLSLPRHLSPSNTCWSLSLAISLPQTRPTHNSCGTISLDTMTCFDHHAPDDAPILQSCLCNTPKVNK